MVPFPMILNDPEPEFQGHGVTIDVVDVLCAQLTRNMFVIAKFLFNFDCTTNSCSEQAFFICLSNAMQCMDRI